MWRAEDRRWLKRLSYLALGMVIFQGLLGGLRVLLVNVDLAKVHGVVAQIFLCGLTAIAVGSSAWWKRIRIPVDASETYRWNWMRNTGLALCALTMAQLVAGSIMRHSGAGLAIPYFPHSSPDGSIFPVAWNWATQLNFVHRAFGVGILLLLTVWVILLIRSPLVSSTVKKLAIAAFLVVNIQIALGAGIIWSARAPIQTTLHVLNGAIFLSIGWAITFSFFKPQLEKRI
jgi:cytochrome c oxidase assembly protein subunit 15